ncbi:hypothetical protein H6P81_012312 [Aristolochia fimbriata]|uniref:Uncharacterized protein n=1 Tax=Aristolochia fimbriata TaxID=158543 RepID=A0AAV7ED25_ARIFI|nr:hypothetical protein H6P81_012312 [Aristolochia fimbriata]
MLSRQMKTILFALSLFSAFFFLAFSTIERNEFPDDFLFGTATSSFQVEGSLKGGKGLSNWDVFTHIPGTIADGSDADVADDHYSLFREDIELLHSLGVNSYRFSLAWSRILPKGRFEGINPEGIAFYNDLIDALVQKGIQPFVTLHHFEIPQELEERYASWLSSQIIEDFAYFAEVCFTAFGDRVKYWTTFNEPNTFLKFGYLNGRWTPRRCSPPYGHCEAGDSETEPYIAGHNLILSHAAATDIYRKKFQAAQGGKIGIVVSPNWYEPLRNTPEDLSAAHRLLVSDVGWFLDPIILGDYPFEMREVLRSKLPNFTLEEKELLKIKVDFIGINHYTSLYAKDCISSPCALDPLNGNMHASASGTRDGLLIGPPTGMPHFFVVPYGIEKIIMYVKDRYNNTPMYITENGYSDNNVGTKDELVNDIKRVHFMQNYLPYVNSAMRSGADVRGYFAWSFLDNFEWTLGYTKRFGIVYVDYETMARTPKLSAEWYKGFLTGNEIVSMDKKHAIYICLE